MKLYLVRHGEAEEGAGKSDAARELTARGRERMHQAALGMQRLGLKFDPLLTSPVIRASATADIIASVYGNTVQPQELGALATSVDPADAVEVLARFTRPEAVMIVGHEPQLSRLVSLLLTGSGEMVHSQFKKGGCVALAVLEKIGRGDAELLWMLTNRQLRSLRK